MCPEGPHEFVYKKEIILRIPLGPQILLLAGYLTIWATSLAQIIMSCIHISSESQYWGFHEKTPALVILGLTYFLMVWMLASARLVLHRTPHVLIKYDFLGLGLVLLGHATLVHVYVYDPAGELVTALMLTATVAVLAAELFWASQVKTFNPLNATFHRVCNGPFIELDSESLSSPASLGSFHQSHSQLGSPTAGHETSAGHETPESDKNASDAATATQSTTETSAPPPA